MQQGRDILKLLAIPNPKGKVKLTHAVKEEPNLGVRKQMEDYTIVEPDLLGNGQFSFHAVLDGHGGFEVAKCVKENLPTILKNELQKYKKGMIKDIVKKMIEKVEIKIKEIGGRDIGTTLTSILVHKPDNMIFYINIGDSNIAAIRYDSSNKLHSDFKCQLHKVSNPKETERVKNTGGTILKGRLAGNLLITRSLGDFDMQEYGLISTPDIYESLLFKNKLVFLASDGIWDVINTIQLLQLLKANSGKTLTQLADAIVKYAIEQGSIDNISLIIVLIEFSENP